MGILDLFLICSAAVILLCLLLSYRKQIKIRRWKKSLNLQEHEQVFCQLYQQINGFLLSAQARQQHDAIELVYGEIEFLPFIALLSLVNLDTKTHFYDLGCGVGKAILACAMVYPVNKCVGIELLDELYDAACLQAKQLASLSNYQMQAQKIEFILGDFLTQDLSDATLIFINATTLIGDHWIKLCDELDALPKLTQVITISKKLHSSRFIVSTDTQIQMSWGIVQAYIHNRIECPA